MTYPIVKRKKNWQFIGVLCLLLAASTILHGKNVPRKPNPPKLVNDYANILNPTERRALERKLVAYDDSTSTEIAIVIENSLEGDDAFDYSYRLARAWGIGGQQDNGVLIYIALAERQIRMQVGYGTEGFLPDAMAKRIIEQIITPAFRDNAYYRGLNQATSAIIQLGNGEYVNTDPSRQIDGEGGIPPFFIFLAILILFIIISRNNGGNNDGGYYGGGRYERRRGGGWVVLPGGGFGGGGGGWTNGGGGGFGGGGFGGFGGGDFGGGGAGGSW